MKPNSGISWHSIGPIRTHKFAKSKTGSFWTRAEKFKISKFRNIERSARQRMDEQLSLTKWYHLRVVFSHCWWPTQSMVLAIAVKLQWGTLSLQQFDTWTPAIATEKLNDPQELGNAPKISIYVYSAYNPQIFKKKNLTVGKLRWKNFILNVNGIVVMLLLSAPHVFIDAFTVKTCFWKFLKLSGLFPNVLGG